MVVRMKLRPATEPVVAPLAHAILSASGAKKWSTCTMSAAMEKGLPDELSEYNREGTCAHAVSECRPYTRSPQVLNKNQPVARGSCSFSESSSWKIRSKDVGLACFPSRSSSLVIWWFFSSMVRRDAAA